MSPVLQTTPARRLLKDSPIRSYLPLAAILFSLVSPFALTFADPPTTAPGVLPDRQKAEDERTNRLWKQFWKDYAARCILFENRFVLIPNYDPKFPSSRNVSVEECASPPAGTRPPMISEEAQAYAMAVPELSVGQYGYLFSGEVAKVFGPQDAVLRNVKILDDETVNKAYQAESDKIFSKVEEFQRQTWERTRKNIDFETARHQFQDQLDAKYKQRKDLIHTQEQMGFDFQIHIKGFDTQKMISGARWSGPNGTGFQVAIIGVESFSEYSESHKQRLVAVPLERFKTGLTEEQFKKMLTERHLSMAQLVDTVMAERRKDSTDFKTRVMNFIKAAGDMDEKLMETKAPDSDAPANSHPKRRRTE